ncbi:MAG: helix-turn-helix domain-containing protein [Thermodesulfovibrionales bacterium]|nr:helix-turn-helix domain-containing protein [Thermodesulfovibrionales bacterium]
MKEWMNVKELSEYLGLPESKIRFLIKQKGIPFSSRLGEPRFNKKEIDEWMRGESSTETEGRDNMLKIHDEGKDFIYRGKPIKDNTLSASRVLIGETPLNRLPGFIKKTVEKVKGKKEGYLYREEFKPFLNNFNDFLRLSCQLGLINNLVEEERKKHYHPTEYAERIYHENDPHQIKQIILESILNIVRKQIEIKPDEKHAVLLLWYLLKLKEEGIKPMEYHFKLDKDKPNNYFPKIRLDFASGLNYFLFEGDEEKEREFLSEWGKLM